MGNEEANVQPEIEMTDEDIAIVAQREIQKAKEEAAKAKKELAMLKMLSNPEEDKAEPINVEECIKKINNPNSTNLEYWEGVVGFVEYETERTGVSPLEHSEEIIPFAKKCIEAANGDNKAFISMYGSELGADDQASRIAYNAWKSKQTKK